ncbi:hypothetical protein ACFHYQ_06090 [Sphaerimonospora cavernae]|uniref:Guanylate kinase n=1 Tax=Sphaerimonospora cavernae TaxID=1740611 RepID=A0ABV6U3Y5_9ACTN
MVETHRYGNVYAVDRHRIEEMTAAGHVPVAHMGNIADLRALVGHQADGWLRVLLWVPREVTEHRSTERGDVDTAARLRAWDEARADLTVNADEAFFHLRLFTDRLDAEAAACEIAAAFDVLAKAAAPHGVAGRRGGVVVRPPG